MNYSIDMNTVIKNKITILAYIGNNSCEQNDTNRAICSSDRSDLVLI